jgi:hypothetical protein
MKYIFHHLGLGDHIICNGMVRNYKQIYGKVTVFCKPHNFKNVEYMYRDDDNIIVLPIGEVWDIDSYILTNNIEKDTIRITADYSCSTFDESFYKQAGIPFEFRYSKFKFLRDLDKEEEIYHKLNPKNEKYIFVHDDFNRGFLIDNNKHRNDLKIIKNNSDFNVFELMKIYENSEEIHFMESSISALINSYVMEKPKLFLHKYVRNYENYLHTKSKNKINVIY